MSTPTQASVQHWAKQIARSAQAAYLHIAMAVDLMDLIANDAPVAFNGQYAGTYHIPVSSRIAYNQARSYVAGILRDGVDWVLASDYDPARYEPRPAGETRSRPLMTVQLHEVVYPSKATRGISDFRGQLRALYTVLADIPSILTNATRPAVRLTDTVQQQLGFLTTHTTVLPRHDDFIARMYSGGIPSASEGMIAWSAAVPHVARIDVAVTALSRAINEWREVAYKALVADPFNSEALAAANESGRRRMDEIGEIFPEILLRARSAVKYCSEAAPGTDHIVAFTIYRDRYSTPQRQRMGDVIRFLEVRSRERLEGRPLADEVGNPIMPRFSKLLEGAVR